MRRLRDPLTKEQRQERRDKCKPYLREGGSLPAAIELADADGFRQNTSVWLGALGELLAVEKVKPGSVVTLKRETDAYALDNLYGTPLDETLPAGLDVVYLWSEPDGRMVCSGELLDETEVYCSVPPESLSLPQGDREERA